MKVTVDEKRCTGHARCWTVLPDLFKLDEFGHVSLAPGTPVPAGKEDLAMAAVESCPERALSIED